MVPSHYRIHLEPDLVEATFSGKVEIEVEVGQATDNIQINSTELVISAALLLDAVGTKIETSEVKHDEKMERATLSFDSELSPGPYTIIAEFTGILNDQLRGFYRSVFTDDDGVEHTIATTQFESTSARRAFPCFDEPAFKASYGVTLVVPEGEFAVSNGPTISETDLGDGRKEMVFEDTMVMSTYLVAFIVGPFEATEPVDVDGVPSTTEYRIRARNSTWWRCPILRLVRWRILAALRTERFCCSSISHVRRSRSYFGLRTLLRTRSLTCGWAIW